MKTQAENSTKPWTPDPWLPFNNLVRDEHGNTIAECLRYGVGVVPVGYVCPWHNAEGNAFRICQAVNQHDQIIAQRSALKCSIHAAHGLLAPLSNQVQPSALAIREAVAILRSALAQ